MAHDERWKIFDLQERVIDLAEVFNTGLTTEQISTAFSRALGDYTDEQIDGKLNETIRPGAWNTVWDTGQDLNTILTPGTYAAACTNLPDAYTASGQAFKLIVEYTSTENFIRQTLIGRTGSMYARTYNVSSAAFGSWEQFITSTEFAELAARVAALEGGA